MNHSAARPVTAYPNVFKSLLDGFDRTSKHMWLVIFPIFLDVLLWLGPRLTLSGLIEKVSAELVAAPQLGLEANSEIFRTNQQVWAWLTEHFNLLAAVRTYPVGVPSQMASRLPVSNPLGTGTNAEITSVAGALVAWLTISLVGMWFGTLFYGLTAQAVLRGKVDFGRAVRQWPRNFLHVLGVTASLLLLYFLLSLPASCLLLVAALSGVGQCIFFLYGGLLVWLLFPFFMSTHGIFVYGDRATPSVMRGARVARLLIVPASLLFISIFVLSQGLDFLWNATADDSWLTLVGIVGHGFVTTALLASTFIFYEQADLWLKENFKPEAKVIAEMKA